MSRPHLKRKYNNTRRGSRKQCASFAQLDVGSNPTPGTGEYGRPLCGHRGTLAKSTDAPTASVLFYPAAPDHLTNEYNLCYNQYAAMEQRGHSSLRRMLGARPEFAILT